MSKPKKILKKLFIFTKEYPFGRLEKYIDHELPLLSKKFDRVILVPCEYFGGDASEKLTDHLPANTEIFDLNREVQDSGIYAYNVIGQALRIWLHEFIVNKARRILLKDFRKNLNILLYQLIASRVLAAHLGRISQGTMFFYSYWNHHSTLMLAAMKQKGWISGFVTRAHSIDLYEEDWVHAGDIHKPLPYGRFKMKSADHIFAISEHGCRFLRNKFPAYASKVSHVYLGVPDNGTGPYRQTDEFTVVTCSIFTTNKRVQLIPRIISGLPFKIRWVHFGSGGEAEQQVMEAVKQVSPNVHVDLRGSVANRDIIEFYRNHTVHLFMNISLAEGVPVAIMEAISFGIPVLATDVYGTPELVTKNNGYLISVNSALEEVSDLIENFYYDKKRQSAMRSASRQLFLEHIDNRITTHSFLSGLMKFPGLIS